MWTSLVKEGFMSKLTRVVLFILLAGILVSQLWAAPKAKAKNTLHIYSNSFKPGAGMPDKYTCKGENISPDISWKGAPLKTQSFALIVEDPDAPTQTWVHWVIYNIPVKKPGLTENIYELTEGYPRDEVTSGGILQGTNDFKKIGYDGPCPPSGIHRYYFELYALDSMLNLGAGVTSAELLSAIKGHVLAQTQMMGTYSK
jgi:Raf kinase inhibitor-like YbhB/YbcL family protein